MTTRLSAVTGGVLAALTASVLAQEPARPTLKVPPLGAGPYVFDTAEQHRVKVVVQATGLAHPWAMAFLPDGRMLVTERPGRLRVIEHGVLNPEPVRGVPAVRAAGLGGLEDLALHPSFAENHLLYFTYIKAVDAVRGTPVLARGRLYAFPAIWAAVLVVVALVSLIVVSAVPK